LATSCGCSSSGRGGRHRRRRARTRGGLRSGCLVRGRGGDRLVPESHTCFLELCLSEYGEDETEELRKHIGVAMEYADVMGGV
jgi:hypothetical protein